ncbi:MAG: toxin-antitoxin system YwqK family antitoxin [Saprospiraceae bacterium]|nr:toxin-antitoxin system YwqK family antitoxin [Saprospiraceae bacterium]
MASMRFILILVAIAIFACNDAKKITIKDNSGANIEEYHVIHDSIKHGTYTSYHPSGKIKESSTYTNGMLTGIRNIYFTNGRPDVIETYDSKGKLNGPYMQYFENGNIQVEKTYTENTLTGIMKIYYPDGKIKEVVTMVENEENGPFQEYYQNGKIHWKGNYRNGDQEFGILHEYDSTGAILKIMKCDTMAICTTIWKSGMPAINTDTVKYE